jgi:hypothetical protein
MSHEEEHRKLFSRNVLSVSGSCTRKRKVMHCLYYFPVSCGRKFVTMGRTLYLSVPHH